MDPARLTAIPIFSQLSSDEAKRLAAFATETSVANGQILMKQGDYSTELIAIEEGSADVLRDGNKIASLKQGDLIGDGPALPRAAQRRCDRDVADASAEAHPLGDPPDVPGHGRSHPADHRRAGRPASPIRRTDPAARRSVSPRCPHA